ncbi:hypothetical protein [Actinomadura oligospora]|uniref:hypothetical protein n=1 Tax=Actinomadura oligospora TaxID=111804 RepID=UPI00047D2250|nr:hypothetical protein [Actinomadura oligospora]
MPARLRALGRIIAATAVAVAGLTAVTAAPARADEPTPSLDNYYMREANNQDELMQRVKELDAELPKLGIQNILAEAPRTGKLADDKACNTSAVDGGNPVNVDFSFCWDTADSANTSDYEWTPQGITTVADAQEDKHWGTAQPLIATWYQEPHGAAVDEKCEFKDANGDWAEQKCVKGARISIIDPNTGRYAHVLLAYPFLNDSGNATYMSLRTQQNSDGTSLHAGGIAWYGNYLYVADTARGLRVFDTRYILDLQAAGDKGDTTNKKRIGRHDGTFYAHGYRYVMPEVGAYTNNSPRLNDPDPDKDGTTGEPFACDNNSSPNTSFVSIDRSGADHLITGEFCRRDSGNTNGRVATWELDGDTGKPKLNATCVSSTPGHLTIPCWHADGAYTMYADNIQGAVRYDNRWFTSKSRGSTGGLLVQGNQPAGATGVIEARTPANNMAIGPEDLSYWPGGDANRSGIWTLTEHPGQRMVYLTPKP